MIGLTHDISMHQVHSDLGSPSLSSASKAKKRRFHNCSRRFSQLQAGEGRACSRDRTTTHNTQTATQDRIPEQKRRSTERGEVDAGAVQGRGPQP